MLLLETLFSCLTLAFRVNFSAVTGPLIVLLILFSNFYCRLIQIIYCNVESHLTITHKNVFSACNEICQNEAVLLFLKFHAISIFTI